MVNFVVVIFPFMSLMNLHDQFENNTMCHIVNHTLMPRTNPLQPLDTILVCDCCELHLYPKYINCTNQCFQFEGIQDNEYEVHTEGPLWFLFYWNLSAGLRNVKITGNQHPKDIYEFSIRKPAFINCPDRHKKCNSEETKRQNCGTHGKCCKLDKLMCSCESGYSGSLCDEPEMNLDGEQVKVQEKSTKSSISSASIISSSYGSSKDSSKHTITPSFTSDIASNPVVANNIVKTNSFLNNLTNNPTVTISSLIIIASMCILLIRFVFYKYIKEAICTQTNPTDEQIPLQNIEVNV